VAWIWVDTDQVIPFIPRWGHAGEDVAPHQVPHHQVLGAGGHHRQAQLISTRFTHRPAAPPASAPSRCSEAATPLLAGPCGAPFWRGFSVVRQPRWAGAAINDRGGEAGGGQREARESGSAWRWLPRRGVRPLPFSVSPWPLPFPSASSSSHRVLISAGCGSGCLIALERARGRIGGCEGSKSPPNHPGPEGGWRTEMPITMAPWTFP